jgi:hypothetical protein
MQTPERVPKRHRHRMRRRLRGLWGILVVGIIVSGLLGLVLWLMNHPSFLHTPAE